jgi:hypothetical protein
MQIYFDFAGFQKNIPKIAKLKQKRALGNFVTSCYEFFFYDKSCVFQKNQLGIGVWCRKL